MKKQILFLVGLLCCTLIGAEELPNIRPILNSQLEQSVINIPKGKYLLDIKKDKAYTFNGLTDVVIEGNGSTLVCNQQNRALNFLGCKNVTVRNLTIEFDPPTISQGTIVEIANDKLTWTVELHEGYPTSGFDKRVLVYDADTRELKHDLATLSTQHVEVIQLEPVAKVRFTIDRLPDVANSPVKVGDFATFDIIHSAARIPHTMFSDRCEYMKYENITIYDSNCFSFFETNCTRSHYYRCVATRKLNDPKYPIDRLRAGVADAFHSKHAPIGPIVEECKFEYTGDDCIAINGRFYPIYKVSESDKTLFMVSMDNSFNFTRGDEFVCVNNNGSIRGKAKVKGYASCFPNDADLKAMFAKLGNMKDRNKYKFGIRLTLDNWINGMNSGDVGFFNNRIGRGFQVLRDTVGGNRARAILLKSADGIVDGCVIRNSAMAGIVLSPEFFWMEGGLPENVIIRNNKISTCMYDHFIGSNQFAAMSVVESAPNGKGFAPAGSLKNISIYNNVITGCPFPAVALTSIDRVYFADNTIEKGDYMRYHGNVPGMNYLRELYRANVTNFSTKNDPNATTDLAPAQRVLPLNWHVDGCRLMVDGVDGVDRMTLFDSAGQLVTSCDASNEMNIGIYPKGLYLLQTQVGEECYTFKIVL